VLSYELKKERKKDGDVGKRVYGRAPKASDELKTKPKTFHPYRKMNDE